DAMVRRDWNVAIGFFDEAVKLYPGNIEVIGYRNQALSFERRMALEEARRRDAALREAAEAEARRRQWELADRAERERKGFVQIGLTLGAPERQRLGDQ